ncbi:MAG: sporulation integral membrane protein YtvI [Syntrophomonas sp.]|nr:sporulation integral membrane protein YtvI [Syntrophomonas sp.]
MDPELQKGLKRLVKWTIFVMILLSLYLLFTYLMPLLGRIVAYFPVVFLPFVFAVVLAIVIEPVVNMFEIRARLKRSWAVLLSLLLVIGGFFTVLFLLAAVLIREMSALYRLALARSDTIIGNTVTFITDFRLSYLQLNLPPQVQSAFQDNLQKGLELIQQLMHNSINGLMQGFAKLPGILIFVGIATVAAFLIIKDRALIRTFVIDIIPASARPNAAKITSELLKALSGFFKAYSILITITAIITLVSLKILGVEYAFLIGILVGIMDILPILGPGTIMVPWIIWEFITGHTGMGISLIVVYIIITVVRQFLEPQIVGDSIGLHPLATLVSLYVGLQLGGLMGMVMGPVVVVIFIACYRAGLFDRFDWREKSE